MADTKTRAELISAALGTLLILQAGQDVENEDYEAVDNHIDPLIARLNGEEIIYVDDANAIPMAVFQQLAVLLADDVASEFGLPGVPAAPNNPDPVGAAVRSLRVIKRVAPTRQPLQVDYF